MPDMLLIIIGMISVMGLEISLLSRSRWSKNPFRMRWIYGWLITLLIVSTWFGCGYYRIWKPYKVEYIKVLTIHRNDGMLIQYLDGHSIGHGLSAEHHGDSNASGYYSVFYPEGTLFKRSYYHPWQTGIYWTNHVIDEVILPK